MSRLHIQEIFQAAAQHHRAGRLAQAEALYRQILSKEKEHAGVLHSLGMIAHQTGKYDDAVELIRRALAIQPDNAEAYGNLGAAYKQKGRLGEAVDAYRRAIDLKPNLPEAYSNLGNALRDMGQLEAAIAACRQAILLRPNYPEAHNNLGNALRDMGQWDQAVTACRRAIALRPSYPEAHNNLGNALRGKGQLDEAIIAFRQAIVLKPNLSQAYNNLGGALKDKGELDDAVASYRRAVALNPKYAEAYSNLGNALRAKGELEEGIAAYRRAIALKAEFPKAYNNLGGTLNDLGQLDEAIAAYRQALALQPGNAEAHSNLLYLFHFHPGYGASSIAEEHRGWGRKHAEPLGRFIETHANDRNPDRRLRIGYVSPDLRQHAVASFLENLLTHHDAACVETFCYADVLRPDATTRRFQQLSLQWRDIARLNDAQAIQMIREDQIDILVDLAGHTANNRLLLFARKPAPIQVTYLGYPDTTGMTAIDYRLTDGHADPRNLTEAFHSEQLVRLPRTFLCFHLSDKSPDVAPLPATKAGYITFGCFNALPKVSNQIVDLWSQILHCLPSSKLLLKSHGLTDNGGRRRLLNRFAEVGISTERLDLRGWTAARDSHLELYNQVDIALDTYPYHGTTTTCEALWMGVPVVTLTGAVHMSRVGVSVLSNVGLSELIAGDQQQYVRIAVELVNNIPRLAELRANLRDRMRRSPLMDGPNFARVVEAAYRQMWRTWCATSHGKP